MRDRKREDWRDTFARADRELWLQRGRLQERARWLRALAVACAIAANLLVFRC